MNKIVMKIYVYESQILGIVQILRKYLIILTSNISIGTSFIRYIITYI